MNGSPDSIPPMDSAGIKINLVLNSDKPKQIIALKNARIITMNTNSDVIENGTIIITDNRITDIGKSSDIKIPAGAKISQRVRVRRRPG